VNVLALDTSAEYLSLALARGEARFARHARVGHRHAETLFTEIAALLDEAGIAARELDAIAYGAGPGAFTGLRIAAGAAQGLAAARGVPVIGVSCLEAIAWASGAPRALVCIDARMDEVYSAAYLRGDDPVMTVASPAAVLRPDAVPVPEGVGWVGCGSGFAAHGAALVARLGGALERVDALQVPTAEAMLDLALPRLAAGAGRDAAEAVPVYLRERVALTVVERRERASGGSASP
jgi:tRNA threonylcarbamoyladenosine biosynthesis protein TsaB